MQNEAVDLPALSLSNAGRWMWFAWRGIRTITRRAFPTGCTVWNADTELCRAISARVALGTW